ncbi:MULTISPECIES: hypothetical protein [Candidatus Cardinium]|uniref:hypothetical protein n=1 Tax=Candidatus Cardinium TaxID=273135 RepID=UPI001FAB0A28|nr:MULTISPECIES: hypothetical protein [Cardinium]
MGQIVSQVTALFLTIGLCFSMLFVKKKHASLVCKSIEIAIQDYKEQSFLTAQELVDLLQATHNIALQKTPLKRINTYAIQQELKSHPLIKTVLVYKTWNGALKVDLVTKFFIARMIRLNAPNGSQIYVDEEGGMIELKGLPILGMLVVMGRNIITEKSKLHHKGLLPLLQYIASHPFWQRQITSLEVADNGKIILGTQIGGHQIQFGYPRDIANKFEKLELFYKEVIPYKGWNTYRRVNLEFENQLICE